jgi:5'-nucleotidase/UDP-sugar diphosphatase
LDSLQINGSEVKNDKFYTLIIQGYHLKACQANLGISEKELLKSGKHKVVTTSAQDVLEEWLRSHQNESRKIEGRLSYE